MRKRYPKVRDMADDHEQRQAQFEQRQQSKRRQQEVRERRTEQEQEWMARPEEQQRRTHAAPVRAKREEQPLEPRAAADPFGELERRHGLDVRPDLSAEERVVRVLARMDDQRAG
jgi:hypothetical protein